MRWLALGGGVGEEEMIVKRKMRFPEFAREASTIADQMMAEHDRHVARIKMLRLKTERLQAVDVVYARQENDGCQGPPEAA